MNRLSQLLQFLQENPNDPFIKYCLALEYDKAGESTKAVEYFTVLEQQHADYVATYYHLGKLYEKLQEKGKAEQTYNKGLLVAQLAKDQHAYSELLNAKNELVNNYDVEFDE
ncbi:MAG: hypothetical protein ACKVPJ_14080 [Chitinophagales bacterium]